MAWHRLGTMLPFQQNFVVFDPSNVLRLTYTILRSPIQHCDALSQPDETAQWAHGRHCVCVFER